MSGIQVSVSWGEAIDKLTILSIKSERIKDAAKLESINKEKTALQTTIEQLLPEDKKTALGEFQSELKIINETLWELEDQVREPGVENKSTALAVLIANKNDERFVAKNKINLLLDSDFKEVKSHPGL